MILNEIRKDGIYIAEIKVADLSHTLRLLVRCVGKTSKGLVEVVFLASDNTVIYLEPCQLFTTV